MAVLAHNMKSVMAVGFHKLYRELPEIMTQLTNS